ncbi:MULTISPECIES: biotin-independent malonate decarboxylase subunit gamma [Mesorhizobium]|uniref:biotin-independent malonate decarboxylase subunit gamma n=1 Tax=Mesorhizobium TaxID=68287 RepID=UPI0003CE7CFA|nr:MULTISPECIES: biotin-independent malonate decarboxylase subunit gamma [Mesorhizobium]ESY68916.1 malonate decarboxylase subunit gamma [Mesorhizobium sp. LNHC232B00]WJI40620.1 biotin-independent malonate decarboxylase subunit gamma [Mesorhizobium opportunistum]
MTLDELLSSLFPNGHHVENDNGVLSGWGKFRSGGQALVIGVADRTALGVDEAIRLSSYVLSTLENGIGPVLVLVDSDSQRMSKRDELLGLNEFLAHLAKCLIYADIHGRATISLLYGHSAAGAFLATALATRVLIGLPGASPAVMDLPSMSKVTKLPVEVLKEKATSTPVFAPGLQNLAQTGAVHLIWDDAVPLAKQMEVLLRDIPDTHDRRGLLGKERHGRLKAEDIAERVRSLALLVR